MGLGLGDGVVAAGVEVGTTTVDSTSVSGLVVGSIVAILVESVSPKGNIASAVTGRSMESVSRVERSAMVAREIESKALLVSVDMVLSV